MKAAQRISTIERKYPDQWVLVEVTRVDRADQATAGRVLARSPDQAEITRRTVQAREENPTAELWAFYTAPRSPLE